MRLLKLLLILCVCAAGPAAAGPLEDAIAAVRKGDYATAIRLLRPLADQGNAAAQHILGIMYDKAKACRRTTQRQCRGTQSCRTGLCRRPVQPRRHVRSRPGRAAGLCGGGVVVSQGCRTGPCRAQYNLGVMYDKAGACRRTIARRCRGFAKLPSKAMPTPSTTSASCTQGHGVPQDYAAAVSWYRKAADQGDTEAQLNLGFMYTSRPGRAAGLCSGGVVVSQSCRAGPCQCPVQPRPHVRARPWRAAGLCAGAHVVQPCSVALRCN